MADEPSYIDGILSNVYVYIKSIVDKVAKSIRDFFGPVADSVKSWFGQAIEGISGMVSSVTSTLQSTISKVIASVKSTVDSLNSVIKNLVSDITGTLSSLIDNAINSISGIIAEVTAQIESVVNNVTNSLVAVFDFVKDGVLSIVDDVKQYFTGIYDKTREALAVVIDKAGAVIKSITDAVSRFVSEVVDTIGGTIRSLLETIDDLPDELRELKDKLVASAKENIYEPLTAIPGEFMDLFAEAFSKVGEDDQHKVTDLLHKVLTSPVTPISGITDIAEQIAKYLPTSLPIRALSLALTSPLVVMSLYSGIANANSQNLLHQYARLHPYQLLSPADLVDANRREIIDSEKFVVDLQKQGYDESDIDIYRNLGREYLNTNEAITLWLRDIYSDTDFKRALAGKGVDDEDIEKLKEAAFFIPPPGDLITMAVREVFSPEVAARFGQFDDYPKEFTEWAGKQGISKEWAERYWAAHWALPSPQMGFEMLHRRIINAEDLNLLLRALDVMPFWRDKLIQMSYAPLTRVDVRRMHKLGVIGDDEVRDAYRDIGYNDENAERLLQFTIEYNSSASDDNVDELDSLTRSSVLGMYSDGIIDQSEAREMLIGLGNSESSADLYLMATNIDIERAQRKEQIALVVEQHKAGIISFNQAQDDLHSLGFETSEVVKAVNVITRQEASKNKLPSIEQLGKMLKKKVINDTVFIQTAQRLGYSLEWSTALLKII